MGKILLIHGNRKWRNVSKSIHGTAMEGETFAPLRSLITFSLLFMCCCFLLSSFSQSYITFSHTISHSPLRSFKAPKPDLLLSVPKPRCSFSQSTEQVLTVSSFFPLSLSPMSLLSLNYNDSSPFVGNLQGFSFKSSHSSAKKRTLWSWFWSFLADMEQAWRPNGSVIPAGDACAAILIICAIFFILSPLPLLSSQAAAFGDRLPLNKGFVAVSIAHPLHRGNRTK